VDSFANKQIFRVDNRQEEQRSTKGRRQTTTMKPIKCLLLLAAVLAFAAANVAALNAAGCVVQPDEDGKSCKAHGPEDGEQCRACCISLSYEDRQNGAKTAVKKRMRIRKLRLPLRMYLNLKTPLPLL
jgi:hypothetical protein